jgi:nitrogen regulatory protein P-II 1
LTPTPSGKGSISRSTARSSSSGEGALRADWRQIETSRGSDPAGRLHNVLESLPRERRGAHHQPQGHGGEIERVETYRGTTVKMELTDKVRIEIGVSDHFVEPTVKAIIDGARTGDVGDGKIFVLPVEHVYRIRTGELDRAAVTPVGVPPD